MVDNTHRGQHNPGHSDEQTDELAQQIAAFLARIARHGDEAKAAPSDQGLDSLKELVQLLGALEGQVGKGAGARNFMFCLLEFVAEWKLLNSFQMVPDMTPVYRSSDRYKRELQDDARKLGKVGVLDLYAYGGVATENAIAVLMEAVGVRPDRRVKPLI